MALLMKAKRHAVVPALVTVVVCTAMLIGLPLFGVWIAGADITLYLQFPPVTQYVRHAPFNAAVFGIIGSLDLIMLAGGGLLFWKSKGSMPSNQTGRHGFFPRWGWYGLLVLSAGWVLSWTRLAWFRPFQEHTFCIPWLGYIVLVNALCLHRSRHSLMTDCPKRFLMLFPASAAFWWFFEYLNRFVQNWYYVDVADLGPMGYALLASMAFATVLPAVLSTYRLILTFSAFDPGLSAVAPVRLPTGRGPAAFTLLAAATGLALIGIYPDYLYPLVWFAPLLIISALQAYKGSDTLFSDLRNGDWRAILASAVAALICGFFWEMWNFYSLARWQYAVPFVNRFHLFAMPLLGYGGYLPFGLECLVIGQMVVGRKWLAPGNYAIA